MKTLQLIAILVIRFSTSSAIKNDCDGDSLNATMIECLTDNGIIEELALKFVTVNGIFSYTEEDFGDQCKNIDNYEKAVACISAEIERCDDGSQFYPDPSQSINMTREMCNDPLFNFKCMVSPEIKTGTNKCVQDNFKIDEWLDKTREEIFCGSFSMGIQCSEWVVKRHCDPHTTSMVARMSKLSYPKRCRVIDNISPIVG